MYIVVELNESEEDKHDSIEEHDTEEIDIDCGDTVVLRRALCDKTYGAKGPATQD